MAARKKDVTIGVDQIPELVLTEDRLGIVGTTGSGKTYAAKGAVERLIRAGCRVCVVDPLGVWWGMRAGIDGAAEGGLDVAILGGEHADVPIQLEDGGALGEMIGRSDVRCIVDLSELGSGTARRHFMAAFLDRLYNTNRQPLHLVLDEADYWAPQRPLPEHRVLQGRVNEICRRGRVRGFVPWLISQRPAVIDKDVLSQVDTLIAMKLTSSNDRDALMAWVEGQADREQGKEIRAALPTLKQGTGYLWAPAHGVLRLMRFPPIATFDSSKTPRRGERLVDADLRPLDLATTAQVLGELRTKLQVEAAPTGRQTASSPADLEIAYQGGWAACAAELRPQVIALHEQCDQLCALLQRATAALSDLLGELRADMTPEQEEAFLAHSGTERWRKALTETEAMRAADPQPIPELVNGRRQPPISEQIRPPPRPRPSAPTNGQLQAAARALLTVLAERAPARFTWATTAVLAGLKPRGGHFNAGVRQLRDLGLIDEDGALVRASEAGLTRLNVSPNGGAHSGDEIREMWARRLPSPAPDMLRELGRRPTQSVADLAAALGKKPIGGHWNSGLKMLRDNHLATVKNGFIHLAGELTARAPY